MDRKAIFPATFSLRSFDDDPMPSVEHFVTVNNASVVFNADLVDSFAITGITPKSASIRLHLRDGTPADKHFECTPAGIIEKSTPQGSSASSR